MFTIRFYNSVNISIAYQIILLITSTRRDQPNGPHCSENKNLSLYVCRYFVVDEEDMVIFTLPLIKVRILIKVQTSHDLKSKMNKWLLCHANCFLKQAISGTFMLFVNGRVIRSLIKIVPN